MSLDSSLYHYVHENGRTYHRYKEGSMDYSTSMDFELPVDTIL